MYNLACIFYGCLLCGSIAHLGTIDFREFLLQLMPPMNKTRIAVIDEAFDKMDVIKDGVLRKDDLNSKFMEHLGFMIHV